MMTEKEALTLLNRLWGHDNGVDIYVPVGIERRIDFVCDRIYKGDIRAQFTRRCATGDELTDFELENISDYLQEDVQILAMMFPIHDAFSDDDEITVEKITELIKVNGYDVMDLFTGMEYSDDDHVGMLVSPVFKLTRELHPLCELTSVDGSMTLKQFRDMINNRHEYSVNDEELQIIQFANYVLTPGPMYMRDDGTLTPPTMAVKTRIESRPDRALSCLIKGDE
jgi:hypothetical protein